MPHFKKPDRTEEIASVSFQQHSRNLCPKGRFPRRFPLSSLKSQKAAEKKTVTLSSGSVFKQIVEAPKF